ncbi:ATP-binding protein [Actinocatenispora sera]|uniref:histidine kinase n=1 Tax=Actinocatenispora sera TaxID=390989 RepID=A0A810LA57_9ACTN|nr:ATP-binding protein [Actinocatenispora sera]BCJ32189.1 histidine kinase [Actinocatenispora sera]
MMPPADIDVTQSIPVVRADPADPANPGGTHRSAESPAVGSAGPAGTTAWPQAPGWPQASAAPVAAPPSRPATPSAGRAFAQPPADPAPPTGVIEPSVPEQREEPGDGEPGAAEVLPILAVRLTALLGPARDSLEALEEREQDPERLAQLYRIDHALTLARRQAELGQVLCGVPVEDAKPQTTALIDVLRAAASAVEYYPRVQLGRTVDLAVVQFAADDVIRVLTELMDNATRLSPPQATVTVSTHLTDTGSALIRVEDHGVGMSDDDLAGWNSLLDGGPAPAAVRQRGTARIGLVAARRLAATHGLTVRLASRPAGGTTATVAVPERLLVELPAASPGGAVLPGAFPAGTPATRTDAPVRLVPRPAPSSAAEDRAEHGGAAQRRGSSETGAPAESDWPSMPVPAHRLAEAGLSPAADALPQRVPVSLRDTDADLGRPNLPEPPPAHHREHLGSWADDVAAFADGTSRAESDRG